MFPHLFSIDSNVIFYIFRERAPRTYYQESVLKFVVSGQVPAGGYWGPGRISCSLRDWEPSTLTQQAGQAPHCPGTSLPAEPVQGDLGRPREHSQVQPRAYITRKVQGNEASPRSRQKTKWQVRHLDQCHPWPGKLEAEAEPNTGWAQHFLQRSSKPGKIPKPKLKRASGPMGKKGCLEKPQDYESKLLEEFEGVRKRFSWKYRRRKRFNRLSSFSFLRLRTANKFQLVIPSVTFLHVWFFPKSSKQK